MFKYFKKKDLWIVGFALFAMFLGAGNIIFPPYMGAMSGNQWLMATLGFVLTGTGLPMLGIVSVSVAGGSTEEFSNRVSPTFSKILLTIILTFIGPLFAVPRTAATSVELSLMPLIGDSAHPKTVLIIGALIFFLICYYFVSRPNTVIDQIGTYLTPTLIIFLLILIFLAVFKPMGEPIEAATDVIETSIFHFGFSTGYQTMDALGAIVFGGTIANTLTAKGYKGKAKEQMMHGTALIAGIGTITVYAGFTWLGASGSSFLQSFTDRTALTVESVNRLAGTFGQILLGLIILFACLTTAIGLLFTATEYFTGLFKNRISFRNMSIILIIISYLISIRGVEGIINLSTPLLDIVYPVVIVLIILNLFGNRIKYDEIFIGGIICAIPFGIIQALRSVPITEATASSMLNYVPLGPEGFAFVIPTLAGCLLGAALGKFREKSSHADFTSRDTTISSLEELAIPGLFNEAEAIYDIDSEQKEIGFISNYQRKGASLRDDLPPNYDLEIMEYTLSEAERRCPSCKHLLDDVGTNTRENLRFGPEGVVLEQHIQHLYACKNCEQAALDAKEGISLIPFKSAELPAALIPGTVATAEAIAHIIEQKYNREIPLYRQEQDLKRKKIKLSRQTMSSWLLKASELYFSEIYDELKGKMPPSFKPSDNILHMAKTKSGDEASTMIYTLVENAKDEDVKIYDYFLWLLKKAAEYVNDGQNGQVRTLTPERFKKEVMRSED